MVILINQRFTEPKQNFRFHVPPTWHWWASGSEACRNATWGTWGVSQSASGSWPKYNTHTRISIYIITYISISYIYTYTYLSVYIYTHDVFFSVWGFTISKTTSGCSFQCATSASTGGPVAGPVSSSYFFVKNFTTFWEGVAVRNRVQLVPINHHF